MVQDTIQSQENANKCKDVLNHNYDINYTILYYIILL